MELPVSVWKHYCVHGMGIRTFITKLFGFRFPFVSPIRAETTYFFLGRGSPVSAIYKPLTGRASEA